MKEGQGGIKEGRREGGRGTLSGIVWRQVVLWSLAARQCG